MKEYVVYHNPDEMGYELKPNTSDHHSIVTNKKVSDNVIGCRVWLLTGEGSPRTFMLHSYFIVDEEPTASEEFQTELSGKGRGFDPMRTLNDEEWFPDFKRTQGNFAFGFQRITEPRFIEGLEAIAHRS